MERNSSSQQDEINESLKSVIELGLKSGSEAIQKGDLETAKDIFLNLLKTAPQNPEINNQLGVIFGAEKNFNSAEQFFRAAINIEPAVPAYHKNLGLLLASQKRFPRAIRELKRALKLDPNDPELTYSLAVVFREGGELHEYERLLNSTIKINAKDIRANNDLGIIYLSKKEYDKAIQYFQNATDNPNASATTYKHLGTAYSLHGDLKNAQLAFSTAVTLDPKDLGCIVNLAVSERNLGNLDEALIHAKTAISIQPNFEPAINALGTILKEKGQFKEALESFEKAIEINGEYAPARINRGFIHLRNGNWLQGFTDLEARNPDDLIAFSPNQNNPIKWDGYPCENKSLYLYSEQGFGDTIQYFRFAKSIIGENSKIVIGVQPQLVRLLQGIFQDIQVISLNDPPPEADVIASLLSLPHLLQIKSEKDISGQPYLKARKLSPKERKLLNPNGQLTIGLNWAGAQAHKEDYKRTIDPFHFSFLESYKDIKFVNLNFDNKTPKPKVLKGVMEISSVAADFDDTAAFISELDLIISVDTALVHLAGALGKKCWALIPFSSDWRWLTSRSDSPWYDSIRLFRQSKLGTWNDLMKTLESELSKIILS